MTRSRRAYRSATGAPSSATTRISTPVIGLPSVQCRFSAGSENDAPVIDGCSVDPYARTSVIPCDAARSASATGTGAPPNPTRLIRRRVLEREAGMVEHTGQEHRGTGTGADVGLEHHVECAPGVPLVDQMDVLPRHHRRQHRTEHAGRVRDGRTHQVRRTRCDPRPDVRQLRRAACGACASHPWVRSSCLRCTPAHRRRRRATSAIAAAGGVPVNDVPRRERRTRVGVAAETSPTTTCRSSSGSALRSAPSMMST